ncbi:hypothetical protein MUY14_06945 [Amycolatopsis sp. FBCC-B4732]|uniref:hypothetical protein n=1 Tax=Amycolatopsis sp. FBCC-B4732 TaxID=3079339 RepID=UPI001FF66195|nr:hypothetical protein [Amycolatopsis sp. FBCC-B4732]UOX90355.1 hypothetical protein MUY14_06945 [Amycolatopsis sp. FBCC-B4732]
MSVSGACSWCWTVRGGGAGGGRRARGDLGVRTAAQLGEPSPEPSVSVGVLPVASALAGLVPGGLRRGSAVSARGSTALVLALLVEVSQEGSWVAIVGMPGIGVVAAAELGVELERLALVPDPGAEVAAVLSALIDGFDLVVLGLAVARRMHRSWPAGMEGRVRYRGAVLLAAGPWPGADLELRGLKRRWHVFAHDGFGHLEFRDVVATSRGRGVAARPRDDPLQLPGLAIAVALALADAPAGRKLAEVAG